ncbi:MAG: transcription-repair coupling factor, partial [Bacteroidetes bacterium]|nr:transcription-repair coupling factor [Bacteroidota bacterium]
MKLKKNSDSFSVLRDVLSLPVGCRDVYGVPEGYDALVLGHLACHENVRDIVHVCRDDVRLAALATEVRAVTAGSAEVIELPAWDCVPYDRSSPDPAIAARRVESLSRLAGPPPSQPRIILATVSSVTQRVPPRMLLNGALFRLQAGQPLNVDALMGYCLRNGYTRASQVVEPGDYAVRGGLIDLYPPGADVALRLDLFGDDIESIRTFDPLTQCSTGTLDEAVLRPVSEVVLTDDTIARFRTQYRELFGTPDPRDE